MGPEDRTDDDCNASPENEEKPASFEHAPIRPNVRLREAEPGGQTPTVESLATGDTGKAGKYLVRGELGRGGAGSVHRGHDQDLGRDVAIKFLHEKHRDNPAVVHRFIEEAQIGGQLQHPGIVPVYDLGMSDGKPFFAMKLIKGQTLAKLLADRESPASDRRHFLADFEQVCQTMAYAHARGVVHRDLKPANIMIGAFGEVQVVDWGMGKVLQTDASKETRADEKLAAEMQSRLSVIETVRSSDSSTQSIMGSVMGTPAYMPPEQAMGRVDQMNERSDVFTLGGVLCEILTGEPPYVGSPDELIEKAAGCKLDAAHERLDACGADPILIDLVKDCLRPAAAARPKNAEALAERVHTYLGEAEKAVHTARVAAAEERVRGQAARTRQRLAFGLVGVVAVGLATSLWFWKDAVEQRGIAEQSEKEAKESQAKEKTARDAAETNLANFNRLSHIVLLETAMAKERTFYPAWPDKAKAMRDWLEEDATRLRNALPELRATLATVEARALPQTDAEKAEDRRRHPRAAELLRLKDQLDSLRRAQSVRSGASQAEEFALDTAKLPKTARQLNELAWLLVDPDRYAFGREPEGLALARRAVAAAPTPGDDRAGVMDTFAWALFANGLDKEAVTNSKAALAASKDNERKTFQGDLKKLEESIASAKPAFDDLTTRVGKLDGELGERASWLFTDDADSFLHSTARQLVTDIEAFEKAEVVAVEQHLAWATRIEELTITRHLDRWNEARLAILKANGETASKLYGASPLELKPQMGLVPIGMNPRTLLWEFYHLRSAWDASKSTDPAELEIPKHADDGNLRMRGRGIVFVLIPGGKFFMGAQDYDEDAPNYDPSADFDEAPVREIELAPYFLSRYELTQGQWARLTGGEYPSFFKVGRHVSSDPAPIGETHPVENIDWPVSDALLTRYGLVLPTEAQWERACRGRTSTPWFTGKTPNTVGGFANILDQSAKDLTGKRAETFDDRFQNLAPVGTYHANDFGLHDMLGNVKEWCREWYGSNTRPPRPIDGLSDPGPSSGRRVTRGGYVFSSARNVRSASRDYSEPARGFGTLGVRAARTITR